jgi:hypothetical protein
MDKNIMKGEIIWWLGDTEYLTSKVEGIVSETLIRFTTMPSKYDQDAKDGYQVNLLRGEIGTVYQGGYTAIGKENITGLVECETYKSIEGSLKYVLHGKWYQNGQYFWFARFYSVNYPD